MSAHFRLPPTEIQLPCGDAEHTVRWANGDLLTPDHDDIDGEIALQALGGEPLGCARVVSAWRTALADPRLLTLASRGRGDQLHNQHSGWVAYAPGRSARFARRRGLAGMAGMAGMAMMSSARPAVFPGSAVPAAFPGSQVPAVDPVALLLRMAPLRDRLVSEALAGWRSRWANGEVDPAVLPALTAALIGRVRYCARGWLGQPKAAVDVQMLAPGTRPAFASNGSGGTRIAVPFDWLVDVWSTEMTTIYGRFTLAAEVLGDTVTLDTIGPAMDRGAVVIRLP